MKDSYPDIEEKIPVSTGNLESIKKTLEDIQKKHTSYSATKTKYLLLKEQLESLAQIQDDQVWKKSLEDIKK
jgi:hemoglobin-like flavoprotein